jgi:adenine-specific DNA-methyltransferase
MVKHNYNKLELTWIGKDVEPKLEPRILIENPEYNYGDKNSKNMLIHGDNLLSLKSLEKKFSHKIKCIYLDPPYNSGNAFKHYDDNIEHSQWLSLMKPRLKILRNLLCSDGSIWISIDDDECHYMKILLDEIFGRKNFVASIIWKKKFSPQNDAKWFSDVHDYILVYAKNKTEWFPNLLERTTSMDERYTNKDNDIRGPWTSSDLSVKTYNSANDYIITTPKNTEILPAKGRCWGVNKEEFKRLVADNRIWFGDSGNGKPRLKKFLSEVKQGITAITIWDHTEVGHNQDAKKEVIVFNDHDIFSTPKPEKLIHRILSLATKEDDWVLDSFLGSGTTAAVALKMKRKFIGIEIGDHAFTHCVPRLKAVVDGEKGGISSICDWKGGSGYKFFELSPTLLKIDKNGILRFNDKYSKAMIINAIINYEGFYPKDENSTFSFSGWNLENDFIEVIFTHLTELKIDDFKSKLLSVESLLICCKTFDQNCFNKYSNISIKKIPNSLFNYCDFDKDDYCLPIIN